MTKSTWIPALFVLAGLAAAACGGSPPPHEDAAAAEEPAAATGSGEETPPGEGAPPEVTVEPWDSPAAGAIAVLGDTRDWFDVTRDGTRATPGAPPLLNATVEVPPGTYQVRVNNTERTVSVTAGEKTVLRTGTLIVEGAEANFWAPYLGEERLAAANPPILNSPLALLPGSYRVELNVEQNRQVVLAESVAVRPGKTTKLNE